MPQKAHPPQVMAIQTVVVAPTGQCRAGHVQVHHRLGAPGDGRHGEAAGVGEQVQHPAPRRHLAHPAAAMAHVEEQADVLVAHQVQPVGQAVLVHGPGIHRLAPQALGLTAGSVAVLQQYTANASSRPGRRLGQRQQQRTQAFQRLGRRLTEQRHQHHALQPVHRDVLQPRPEPATAMEQAPGLGRRLGQGRDESVPEDVEGIGSHGDTRREKGRHSKPRAASLESSAPSATLTTKVPRRNR